MLTLDLDACIGDFSYNGFFYRYIKVRMINKINYKSKNLILSIAAIGVGALTVIVTATQALNGEWFIEQKDKASVSENVFFTAKASLSDLKIGSDFEEVDIISAATSLSTTTDTSTLEMLDETSDEEEITALIETVSMEEQATATTEQVYSVTAFETPVTMYTNERVNVRSGAGTEYDRLTTLSWATALSVTGVTDNGWYQIEYAEDFAYVSAEYVQDTQPSVPYVFVGDSRTVQMENAVGTGNNVWISKVGQGYSWFKNQIDLIDDYAGSGTKVIINMGVNDLANASKYIKLINSYMDSWTEQGITVYYAAVTPVYDGISVSNSQIETFNQKMQEGLDSRITWIDGYSYLVSTGFSSSDGLHYNNATYRSLYSFYTSTIESLQ